MPARITHMSQAQSPQFTPYPAYKPSGVEWIGDIPAHWQMRRLKYSAKLIMGQSPDGRDCAETPIGLPFLQGCAEFGDVHPTPVLYCRAPRKISPTGAILLSVRAPVGRLNFADQEYVIGRGLCAILPDGETLDPTFAYYHLQALDTGLRLASTGSTYDAVSLHDIRVQPIIAPPLAEQRAIAAYLDRIGDLAHRYADVATRIIALLRELRQSEIRQAVTRGLDEDAPLRPSGVEWLGDIPAHWDARRLKYLATIVSGATPSTIVPSYWDGDVPWITPQDLGRLTSRYIGGGARNISQAGYDACGTKIAPAKSLVISTRAPIGHTAILSSDACVNQGCRLLTPKEDAHSEFLYFQLTSFRNELASFGQGSTFTELSRMKLGGFKVAAPPLAEQRAIAAHLDARTTTIDAGIAYYERMAALVSEYWASLTLHAVTGRMDVRGEV